MPLLIGTDEAGYGPNLGPLVVTATSWVLPDDVTPESLWQLLEPCVTQSKARRDSRLHVADSKQVYSSGKSIRNLETSVLAFLRQLSLPLDDVLQFGVATSDDRFRQSYEQITGDVVPELPLPVAADPLEWTSQAERLSSILGDSGIRLETVRSRIVFAPEFNNGVERYGSKGKILSDATLSLVREAVDHSEVKDGWVFCDKHGGRNRYDDVISTAFDDEFVFRIEESRAASRYRVGGLEFCFRTKAEELLPVALASMVAKYTRELVMMQFNAFWQHHLPDLKATKGYPVDAKRFWDDISDAAADLGLPRETIWRCR